MVKLNFKKFKCWFVNKNIKIQVYIVNCGDNKQNNQDFRSYGCYINRESSQHYDVKQIGVLIKELHLIPSSMFISEFF